MKNKIKFFIFFFILICGLYFVTSTSSRYMLESDVAGSISLAIPKIAINSSAATFNMVPGDTQNYEFSIDNFINDDISEVELVYAVNIEQVGENTFPINLYKLYDITDSENPQEILLVEDLGFPITLGYGTKQTKNYRVVFKWNESDDNSTYANKSNTFKVVAASNNDYIISANSENVTINSYDYTDLSFTLTDIDLNNYNLSIINSNPYPVKIKIRNTEDNFNVSYTNITNGDVSDEYIILNASSTCTFDVKFSRIQDYIYENALSDGGNKHITTNFYMDIVGPYNMGEVLIAENKDIYINLNGDIINALKIGDFVDYTPVPTTESGGTYTVLSKYSGYDTDQDFAVEDLGWRILNINEDDGTVDLISAKETATSLYLGPTNSSDYNTTAGSQAFNNGVYLLNDVCETLYGNSSKNAVARSTSILDYIDHYTSHSLFNNYLYTYYIVGEDMKVRYPTDYHYGETKEFEGYVPTQQINDESDTVTEFYKLGSQKRSLIEPEDAYTGDLSTTRTIKFSYFDGLYNGGDFISEDNYTIIDPNGNIYRDLLAYDYTNMKNYSYWLASRAVQLNNTDIDHEKPVYHIMVSYGGPNYGAMVAAYGYAWPSNGRIPCGIRPIVTLPVEYININTENDGSSLEKAYVVD